MAISDDFEKRAKIEKAFLKSSLFVSGISYLVGGILGLLKMRMPQLRKAKNIERKV